MNSELYKILEKSMADMKIGDQENLLKEGASERQLFDAYNHFNSCLGILCWQLLMADRSRAERKILSETLVEAWKQQLNKQLEIECDKLKTVFNKTSDQDREIVIKEYRKEREIVFQKVEVTIREVLDISSELGD